ncbi:hypothetical protein [Actinomadura sp. WAC 06369]|uniref:hypothetical protein n=1 Tax=Actinomadura sp. WAC 06369 TaxID=2203193 RepID=UPI000F7B483C|nr:hypothetical protein [Actinomadura sp. WAC 06369]RSN45399.1 hypothetical protein DMH08_36690 [Actinomadura sp. WAC 06369]
MDAASIRREADGLRGRHVCVLRSVARLLAVAGFAFAGWLALAALNDAAMADDGTPRSGAPRDLAGPLAVPDGPGRSAGPAAGPAARPEPGLATLRHFKVQRDWSPRETAEVVADDVHEVGERPVGYLRDRGSDLARDKDTAVRAVRDLGTAAGVPDVRLRGDANTGRPVLTGLVRGVADTVPAPAGDASAAPGPAAEGPEPEAAGQPAFAGEPVHVGDGKVVPAPFADAVKADDLPEPDGCTACRGGHGPADTPPVLPGQDGNQRGGSAPGGHPFAPFADLAAAVDPAAPLGMDLRAFRRTSLTDIAAPGGPAVVPD